jgi:hypothetical protein
MLAAVARLREECRRAKEALSADTDATIQVYLPVIQTEVRVTRVEFESMIQPRIRETIQALGRAVRSAGLEFEDLDRVLLVGGPRIPLSARPEVRPTGRSCPPQRAMALGSAWPPPRYRRRGCARDRGPVVRVCGRSTAAGPRGRIE